VNCERARDLLWSRQTSEEQDIGLDAHLGGCVDCRSIADAIPAIALALDAERTLVPSRELHAGLLAVPDRDRRRRRLAVLALPVAALLCVMSSAVLWGVYPRFQLGRVAESPAATAAVEAAHDAEAHAEPSLAAGSRDEATREAVPGRGETPGGGAAADGIATPSRGLPTRLALAPTPMMQPPGSAPAVFASATASAERGADDGRTPRPASSTPASPTAPGGTVTPETVASPTTPRAGGDFGVTPTATDDAPGAPPGPPAPTDPHRGSVTPTQGPERGVPSPVPGEVTLTPAGTNTPERPGPGFPVSPTPLPPSPPATTVPPATSSPAPTLGATPSLPTPTEPAPDTPTYTPAPDLQTETATSMPSASATVTITPTLTLTPTPGLGARSPRAGDPRLPHQSASVRGARLAQQSVALCTPAAGVTDGRPRPPRGAARHAAE
jgi:hypothetical protein